MGFDPVRALDEDKGEIPNAKYQKEGEPKVGRRMTKHEFPQPQESGYG